jgi:hypothetical protein
MRISIKNPTTEVIKELLGQLCEQYKIQMSTTNLYLTFLDKKYYYDFFNIDAEEQAFLDLEDCSFAENEIILSNNEINDSSNKYMFL